MPSLPGTTHLDPTSLLELADALDAPAAQSAGGRLQALRATSEEAFALGVIATAAFPGSAAAIERSPTLVASIANDRFGRVHDRQAFLELVAAEAANQDVDEMLRALRVVARQQRLRIALRELLPHAFGGADFKVTAQELSELAEALVEAALGVARREVDERFGPPMLADGRHSAFAVLGMGKLSGRELNAGSDIDLIYVYDSDEGEAAARSEPGATITLHEYWSRVARKLTGALDDVTDDGVVWRVDLRLRPEGRNGPMVNSVPAMLRYYETWGRMWERGALMRARPIAGDLELGRSLLDELEPFVFRKHVDPAIATEFIRLVDRSRNEASLDPARDLKLGLGGIRELEMFVQVLQLIWGGVDASVRASGTLEGLNKLWAHGLVTGREAEELADGWHVLRRAEHMVQNSTGLQTHLLPVEERERSRLARSLGYRDLEAFDAAIAGTRERVHARLRGLAPQEVTASRWQRLLLALEAGSEEQVWQELVPTFGTMATRELARDLLSLAQRPDDLLGALTRDRDPTAGDTVLDSLADAADPEQAVRYLCSYFSRVRSPAIHASLLAGNPRAARRFISVLGASAFVGDVVVRRPELGDQVPFSQGMPSIDRARSELDRELQAAMSEDPDDPEALVGALRRARLRVTMEVALADIGGEVELGDVQRVLTELADASMQRALGLALASRSPEGFCVFAVGKYGGQELGYGSDLDVFFVFDPERAAEGADAIEPYVRIAQKTMRLLSVAHVEGPGYELDTRLRPSGSQGVLVSSLPAFMRYHGLAEGPRAAGVSAAPWERQTLIRARRCAGDPELGARVVHLAHRAAFEGGPPDPAETHRLRTRLEREIGREKGGRRDIKVGRGGLLDIEFAVQMLQMRHGADLSLRVAGTLEAILRLQEAGHLPWDDALTLREGYLFLRKLEQRLHIVHATSMSLLEDQAPGLVPLARRMGFHNQPHKSAQAQLWDRYREITEAVRATYLRVLGIP
ncbi:MAG: bifunctional [glutamate--ammonia ligase]-adenylyl-L-tyrosine phosphorylase/[glutamate--ammonia-ligase] adenylyltransferase [Deltaproteobacteria bacterium]|nr:bifunctional [glutamate--ammonia ligase]-adenylyl-L-tyrosine phosphorylase/[glutamate--ammonia-ligase] adenylyltransferase [Deltaproteobacteria bacterium]